MQKTNVLAISGSLRAKSFNTALVIEAVKFAPANMDIQLVTVHDIPLYNMDFENPFPDTVVEFRNKIKQADGIWIVSPEHNHSVPGVLKNAIDWASREPNVLEGKPVGISGCSDGRFATVRGYLEWYKILGEALSANVMNYPQLLVATAQEKFTEDLVLTHPRTQEQVRKYLEALMVWIIRYTPHNP